MSHPPDWLVLPDDPAYASIRRRYVGRSDRLPAAVAFCRSSLEVAAALGYARQRGLDFAVRGSGHSYADHSSTSGLLIDLSAMRSLNAAGGVATVGSGLTLGVLSDDLARHGRLVPSGSCPTVAVGGIALAGGFGFRGRLHGLTTDQIVGCEIVLADGSVTQVDSRHDADLFWALRGAGAGNFGVVTSLTLQTFPLTPLQAVYARWPLEHAVTVLDSWQRWAPYLPDEATIEAYLVASDYDDEPPYVEVWGVSPGQWTSFSVLELSRVPPTQFGFFDLAPQAAARYLSGWMVRANEPLWVPEGPFDKPAHAYVKSEFFNRLIPVEALDRLVRQLISGRVYGEYRDVEFTPWRGAYARANDTAFVHRDPVCLISHTVLNGSGATGDRLRSAGEWLNESWAALHSWGNGHVYQGYPDPSLDDWEHAYYGPHVDRLRMVKSKYDPENFFHFAQSLGGPAETR